MRISTGRGDGGRTTLGDMSRVSKTDPRIAAYGTVDELNALLGRVRPVEFDDVEASLSRVQNHLFIVQADLANPDSSPEDPQLGRREIATVERDIERVEGELEPQDSFILPGGEPAAALLHHTCTVCRRAERRIVDLQATESINDHVLTYLNRLSDLLFTFARLINARHGTEYEAPTY